MVVISSAEFRNNMKKYLDAAKKERIIIQRGKMNPLCWLHKTMHPMQIWLAPLLVTK